MTQTPPGWYADPDPRAPAGGQRYWDGSQWTPHVHLGRPAPVQGPPTTADGVPLAGWWQRFGAYLLDSILTFVLGTLLSLPFLGEIVDALRDFLSESMEAARKGVPGPSAFEIYQGHMSAFVAQALIGLLVVLTYHALCLRLRGATLGMSVAGIAVRRLEGPGRLPWGTVAMRVGTQYGPTAISVVPLVGTLAGLYVLIDGLWPLWDARRQALHDKAAGTQVVRTR